MSVRRSDTGLQTLARNAPVGAPSTRIGRYQLISRLAVGGMAEVYLARHGELTGFKTLVVVKKVLPHLAENPEFISMFLDEARIASQLDHPNVVRIFEVGRAGNEFFLAMELVQGKPLASVLRRAQERGETLNQKLAALMVAHAAGGLHHAHGLCDSEGRPLGLVHRDVSPQNILISFEGSVKVIDFGIARALGRLTATSVGGMKGKIGYMSPEQAKSEEVDHRTDIFALGVVLWEALTCKRLFTRENDFATMQAIVYDPIPRPSTVVKVSPTLENIVMKALSRDPAARFQSGAEMGAALERYVFQSGGASTGDLATLMKTYFSEDQVKWKNTARAALDMEDPEDAAAVPEIQMSQTSVPLPLSTPVGPRAVTPLPPPAIGWSGSRRLIAVGVGVGAVLVLLVALLSGAFSSRKPAAVPAAAPSRPSTPEIMALPAASPAPAATSPPAPPHPGPTRTEPAGETARAAGKKRRPASTRKATPPNNKGSLPDRLPNPF